MSYTGGFCKGLLPTGIRLAVIGTTGVAGQSGFLGRRNFSMVCIYLVGFRSGCALGIPCSSTSTLCRVWWLTLIWMLSKESRQRCLSLGLVLFLYGIISCIQSLCSRHHHPTSDVLQTVFHTLFLSF